MSMQKSAVELRIEQLLAENAELRKELHDLAELKAYVTLPLRERCAQRKALEAENEALRPDAEKWRARQARIGRVVSREEVEARKCLACGERNGHGGLPCPRLNTYLASIGKDGAQ